MKDSLLLPHFLDLGDQLVLRMITREDSSNFYKLITIDDVRRNIEAFGTMESRADAEGIIDAFYESYQEGNGILWGIIKAGVFVGIIGLSDLSFEPIVFYAMDKKWRMQRIMSRCVESVINFVHDFGYSTIKTQIRPDNIASKRLLVHCGFCYIEDDDYYHHYVS